MELDGEWKVFDWRGLVEGAGLAPGSAVTSLAGWMEGAHFFRRFCVGKQ